MRHGSHYYYTSVTRHHTTPPQNLIHIFNYFLKKLISFLFHIFIFQCLTINMTVSTCSICFEGINASNHKPVRCPLDSCAKTACRSCYQTFLCGDDVSVPKCMFCNTQFTHSQLQHIGLTKAFLTGEFAKHQQDILFAQEQAMLPAAQAAVAHDKLVKNIDDQIKDIQAQIKALTALKIDLVRTKHQLMRHDPSNADADADATDQFIHRCADSECNGFVSSAWKCATCEKHTCAHCRELKAARDDPDHVCNPDTVASVTLLKNDTKPCPNCKVLVHKTEGCDQMFCTQCKRLWSWNTGKFETRGHNPHYLQWMRENHAGGMPRDPADVLCGREIDPRFLVQLHSQITAFQYTLMARKAWNDDIAKNFGAISVMLNSITHLRFHDQERFAVDRVAINLSARKAFVANSLSLSKFKQTIRRNHLLANKNEHISQIIQAVVQATTDIAFRLQHDIQNLPLQDWTFLSSSFAQELFNLKTYANSELSLIHSDFQSTPSKICFFSQYDFKFVNILKHSTSSFSDTRFPLFNSHNPPIRRH